MTKLDELKEYILDLECARRELEDRLIENGDQYFVDQLEKDIPYKKLVFPSKGIMKKIVGEQT